MKRVFVKNENDPVDIILLRGTYSSASQVMSQYPDFFKEQNNNPPHCKLFFNPESIERFIAGQYEINRYKTYIFLIGHYFQPSKTIAPILQKFYDKGFNNVVYSTDNIFKTLELKELKTRRKCECDSLDLFRFGCRCGGV